MNMMLTDKQKVEVLSKVIDNLLPPYQKGDTLYYRENRTEATFCYFSHSDNGDVFCVLQPVFKTNPDAVHDFFSACVIPIDQVYTSSEVQEKK